MFARINKVLHYFFFQVPATLRLLGSGLTQDTEVLFTAEAGELGDPCTVRTSNSFRVSGYLL